MLAKNCLEFINHPSFSHPIAQNYSASHFLPSQKVLFCVFHQSTQKRNSSKLRNLPDTFESMIFPNFPRWVTKRTSYFPLNRGCLRGILIIYYNPYDYTEGSISSPTHYSGRLDFQKIKKLLVYFRDPYENCFIFKNLHISCVTYISLINPNRGRKSHPLDIPGKQPPQPGKPRAWRSGAPACKTWAKSTSLASKTRKGEVV